VPTVSSRCFFSRTFEFLSPPALGKFVPSPQPAFRSVALFFPLLLWVRVPDRQGGCCRSSHSFSRAPDLRSRVSGFFLIWPPPQAATMGVAPCLLKEFFSSPVFPHFPSFDSRLFRRTLGPGASNPLFCGIKLIQRFPCSLQPRPLFRVVWPFPRLSS